MVNAFHTWLISILWNTAEASNSQISTMDIQKMFYIVTGNDVIGYFLFATNSVIVTGASLLRVAEDRPTAITARASVTVPQRRLGVTGFD